MAIKIRWLSGNIKSCTCDKCGRKDAHSYSRICIDCYSKPLEGTRIRDFKHEHVTVGLWREHYDKCRLCGSELEKDHSKELCFYCVNGLHPDNSHHSTWGHGKLTRSFAKNCIFCGGVQVAILKDNQEQYVYYRIGSREPRSEPYECDRAKRIKSDVCKHDWIEVLTNVTGDKQKAEKEYKKLMKEDTPIDTLKYVGYERDIVLDAYERIAYGESFTWCWNCGAFYNPTGKPNFKLLSKGLL